MAKFDLSMLKKLAPSGFAKPSASAAIPTPADEIKKKEDIQKLQIELLNLIVERYKKFIEDGETKSLPELRSLIRPMDSTVTEIKIQIQDQFHPYDYNSNYLPATQKAMDIVFAWKKIKMPLSFWMSFEDMVRLKAADDIDRAIILCSIFRALGSDSAKVIIGKDKSAWVSFVFSQKTYVVNMIEKTMSAYPDKSEGLLQFMYSASYAFNDRDFEDLGGDEEEPPPSPQ
ncbi:MAG: hypothetical protein V1822_03335 [Candidatus Micrarchaeota archaeon]